MHMKIVQIFSLLLLSLTNYQYSYSQDYIPFNFPDGVWIEKEFCKPGNVTKRQLFCKGDTLIDSHIFNKLFEFSISFYDPGYYPDTTLTHYIGAIRNNASKQVLYRSTWDTSDVIIYDFNLNLGDTIVLADGTFIISYIDSIEYCGRYHTRYIESIGFPCLTKTLIEGIGFSNGLFGYYGYFGNCECYTQFICYTEWNNQSCSNCEFLLGEKLNTTDPILFPNPTDGELYINSVNPIYRLQIMDIIGRELYDCSNIYSCNYSINIEGYKSGFYLIKIGYKNKTFWSTLIQKD